jgi:hypothetical protein
MNGTVGAPGTNGNNGTITIISNRLEDDWDSESEEDLQFKRRIAKLNANTKVGSVRPARPLIAASPAIFSNSPILRSAVKSQRSASTAERPVAFVQSMVPDVSAATIKTVQATTKLQGLVSSQFVGAEEFSTRPGQQSLTEGHVVAAPSGGQLDIATTHGVVTVKDGAKALIVSNAYSTSVLNLHDARRGEVSVKLTNGRVNVAMGTQLTVTPVLNATFADVNPTPDIAVRDIKDFGKTGELRTFTADFSLLSAILENPTLRALSKSSDRAHKKQIERVLKNACAATVVTGKSGVYKKVGKKPDVVASL